MSPQLAAPPALNRAFAILAAEWRAATRLAAGPAAAADHPAYRAVVRLGPGVVPLLLAALADAPDPWFAALRELTGADPVPPPDRGRPARSGQWLAWGHARGRIRLPGRTASRSDGPGERFGA